MNAFKPTQFYFMTYDVYCDSLNQNWKIVSLGINWVLGITNNSNFTREQVTNQL